MSSLNISAKLAVERWEDKRQMGVVLRKQMPRAELFAAPQPMRDATLSPQDRRREIFQQRNAPLGMTVRIPFDKQLPKPTLKFPGKRQLLDDLKKLLESGKVGPIIAKTFPLHEVPAAIRCLRENRTPGRIVIIP